MDKGRRLFPVPAFFWLILAPALVTGPGLAENVDPDSDGSQYAWGENVGWISAEQDVDGDGVPDLGVHVEDFKLTGWMWGENIGWISLSCLTTESCGNVIYRVLNDGGGTLTGQAWGENVGWISFSCTNTESCDVVEYGVTVDVSTGEFSGQAWAENVGWINFDFQDAAIRPFRIKSAWNCDPPPGPPEAPPELLLAKQGGGVRLSWTAPPGATGYDVILGDLSALRISGDFEAATTGCIGNHRPVTTMLDTTPLGPGGAVWFLVRAVNCGGNGSYDTGEASQVGLRDDPIETSGNNCD